MTTTLIAIADDMLALSALLDDALDASGGEITPDIEKTLDTWFSELGGALEEKADGYAAIVRERTLRASVRRAEMERLQKLVAADENLAKRLKGRLRDHMQLLGIPKIETERYSIRVQKNGGHAPITVLVPATELPPEYQVVTVAPATDAIRKLLKATDGGATSWARMEPPGSHLRIS